MLETTTVQIILRIQKQVSRTKAFSLRHPEESRADLWQAWPIHSETFSNIVHYTRPKPHFVYHVLQGHKSKQVDH